MEELFNINVLIISNLIFYQSSIKTRKKFVPVMEDCMLLGVGVIAVAAFIFLPRKWEEVKQFFKITSTTVFILIV